MAPASLRNRAAVLLAVVALLVTAGGLVAWIAVRDTPSVGGADRIPVRGASLPFRTHEAEDGETGGGAVTIGPNRTIGDLAGEASGRRAVTLDQTGAYVEWTTTAAANALVTRFSVPDGTDTALNVYVDGEKVAALTLTSRFAWLYGEETAPVNSPAAGAPRHIYDEANVLLPAPVPAGRTVRLQKDEDNPGPITVDFIDLEQADQIPNPDPDRYAVPDGYGQDSVQAALDRAAKDTGLLGVYLPAGDYPTTAKFRVTGRAVRMVGAGPWFTRFRAPEDQENTDIGLAVAENASGSTFADFAYFGNYTSRVDGPGKVFDARGVSELTVDNLWVEHQVVFFWGQNADGNVIRNSRIRNLFADGVNLTNGSSGNRVVNNEARSTGDDSFALFAATDASRGSGGSDQTGNVFEKLTAKLTWRAAGVAVYGGHGNTFSDIHIADTLTYAGITVSSYDFGIAMTGFGASPPTRFEGVTVERSGGHFFGNQTFPAVWLFSASEPFQAVRFADLDVVDPTYSGVMFQTNVENGRAQNPMVDTAFTDLTITGARRSNDQFAATSGYGILVLANAVGSASFDGLRMSGNVTDVQNNSPTFPLTMGAPQAVVRPPTVTLPASGRPSSSPPPPPSKSVPASTAPPSSVNLAAGKRVAESGHTDVYVGKNITDGKPSSYWEGPKNAFPATLTVDLGRAQRVGRLTLALPPLAVWETRHQTITVLGSTDGRAWSTLAGSRSYTFNPSGGNRTTANLTAPGNARYLRLEFRGNTGWPAGQLSELGAFTS